MTAHLHDEYVDGCFRCELSRDEGSWIVAECVDGCEDFTCYGECNPEDAKQQDGGAA